MTTTTEVSATNKAQIIAELENMVVDFSAVDHGLRTPKQTPRIIGSLYKWA
jgi:hypothetical protein